MRFLVVSDTHRDARGLKTVYHLLKKYIDAIIHLGDGASDVVSVLRAEKRCPPVYQVRGNMDLENELPLVSSILVGDKKILLLHGHRIALSQGASSLVELAKKEKAVAIFYGHTHVPFIDVKKNILIVNPGSLSQPRSQLGQTFAIVDAFPDAKFIDVKFYSLVGSYSNPKLIFVHP